MAASQLGPYRFIGQVNLADIPKGPHGLPGGGLLSFFYAHDENGESFWGDPDYVRVYGSKVDALKRSSRRRLYASARLRHSGFNWARTCRPGRGTSPPRRSGRSASPSEDAYWELRLRLHPSGRYLLGYPFNTTLAYDPTPGPEWRSLLTLSSDDELEWCWHDGDWLVTFIEQQRLRAGDFSQIKADAG